MISFKVTAEATDAADFNNFDDSNEVLNADYIGTWYSPDWNEAMRLYSDGCFIYMPGVEEYGDVFYEWNIVDRSERGLCPMLEIYYAGRDVPGMAYYIGGKRDDYFWCNTQGLVFYKQED